MKKTIEHQLVAMTAALILAAATSSGATDPKQIAKAREESFKTLGRTVKDLTHEVEKSSPDWSAIINDTKAIERLATELPDWFPAGSGLAAGVKTSTLDAVWSKAQEFKQDSDAFTAEAQKMVKIAGTTDSVSSRTQVKILTGTCRTCHRSFRSAW
jgi:cytochrome c556